MTPQEIATAYVETINRPANGWGQHVHPTLGRSDYIMLRLRRLVGEEEADKLIDAAMKMKQQAFGIWCEVWGGVLGHREGWHKGFDGEVVRFDTFEEADAKAKHYSERTKSNPRASFRYTAKPLGVVEPLA